MIKSILLFLLISFNSFADITEIPTYMCDTEDCSVAQQQILNSFLKSGIFNPGKENVYSGECYHNSESTNPNYKHYGVGYFKSSNNELFWDGYFAFFFDKNPYADMNVESAQEKFGNIVENPNNRLEKLKDYLFINYGDEENFTRYWMRADLGQKNVYVLGYWGIDHRIFCHFKKNK